MRMSDKEVKCSKKEHKCYKCKKIIEMGSNYFILTNRENWGRTVISDKICPECYNKLPDDAKCPPRPKKPKTPIERKPLAVKISPYKRIGQHEVELLCKEADIHDLREELESLISNIKKKETEAAFYKKQIETAKKRNKEAFNENVFLHKRKVKNV